MRPPLDGLRRNPPTEWSRATREDNTLSWENNISRIKNHWQWFSTLQLLEGRILTLPPERGCVADQPQRLRKADGWNSPAASGFSTAAAGSQSGAVSRCALLEFKPGDKIKASAKDGELVFAKKQIVKL
jgi:hypothetical protein